MRPPSHPQESPRGTFNELSVHQGIGINQISNSNSDKNLAKITKGIHILVAQKQSRTE